MIEVAEERYVPFRAADEVLARSDAWAVVNKATREVMITCRVRGPREGAKWPDSTLTVKLDAPWRRYGDLAWVRVESRELAHCGRFAHEALRSAECRQWTIMQRLWPYLVHGEIPATVDIVADDAFVRGRRLRFQGRHAAIWRLLIKPPSKRARWYNGRKLELVDRFGELTEKELEKIAAQADKRVNWEKLDDGSGEFRCSECGAPVTNRATLCVQCRERLFSSEVF